MNYFATCSRNKTIRKPLAMQNSGSGNPLNTFIIGLAFAKHSNDSGTKSSKNVARKTPAPKIEINEKALATNVDCWRRITNWRKKNDDWNKAVLGMLTSNQAKQIAAQRCPEATHLFNFFILQYYRNFKAVRQERLVKVSPYFNSQ